MSNQVYYNLVFIRYSEDIDGFSIFQCPSNIVLQEGEGVSCNTRHGRKNGICVTNSFVVAADTAQQIIEACGGIFPPQDVTGIVQEETRMVYVPFE